jgi:hypothetical protein
MENSVSAIPGARDAHHWDQDPQVFGINLPRSSDSSYTLKYGASTRDILRSLGYDEEAIRSLIDRAVVSESWSEAYLPD